MAKLPQVKAIKLSDIRIDGGTQQRVEIDQAIVDEYAESMRCGSKFPPVTLFHDGAQYWLADGFHRYWGSRAAEMLDILADIHDGMMRDAILYSTGANCIHGKRLTNEDKRKAVSTLLSDKEWSEWSDREIAKHCKVTHPFVAKLRNPGKLATTNKVVTVTTPPLEAAPILDAQILPADDNHYDPDEEALSNAHETIIALDEENRRLKDAIAVGHLPEPEQSAGDIITELRARVKTLEATLAATESQRDTLMGENASLKQQCLSQARKLKKYESGGNVK